VAKQRKMAHGAQIGRQAADRGDRMTRSSPPQGLKSTVGTSLDTLDKVICESLVGLFAVNGVNLDAKASDAEGPEHTLAASIGFAGERLRGVLVLTAGRDLVAASRPTQFQHLLSVDAELCDWMGELANQLLGRIKNRLLRYGIDFEMSIPAVVQGRHLKRALPDASLSRQMCFSHAMGSVCLCFDARADNLAALMAAPPAVESMAEGEVMLF
jgi:CheY-specific phosphatase CheX